MWVVALTLGAVAWSAPASCPTAEAFVARVGPVSARVEAQVVEREGGFELRVTIDDQVRTVHASTCDEAADVAVFLVELSTHGPGRAPLVVPQPPRPSPVELASKPVEPAPKPIELRVEPRVLLAGVAGGEWILLPEPVVRLGVSFQLDVPWLRLVAEVRTAPTLRFVSVSNAVVVLTPVLDAQLGACRLFRFGRFAVGPCVQGGFGLMEAAGFDGTTTRSSKLVPVWTAGPAARAALHFDVGFEVQAFAAARFGPRPAYLMGEGPPVVSTSLLGLDLGVLAGVRW